MWRRIFKHKYKVHHVFIFLYVLLSVSLLAFLLTPIMELSNRAEVIEKQEEFFEIPKNLKIEKIAYIISGGEIVPENGPIYRIAETIYGTTYWMEDVDPYLIARLVRIESRGDSMAVSSAGAVGLGQIIPRWWQGVFPECGDNLYAVRDNICYTVKILNYYKNRSSTLREALLLYNGCKSPDCEWYASAVADD